MINMSYKILIPNNSDGTFTFTKEDLEKLLDDVYNEGYKEGKKAGNIHYIPYPQINNPVEPYNPLNPYVTWMGSNDVPPSCRDSSGSAYSTVTTTRNEGNL